MTAAHVERLAGGVRGRLRALAPSRDTAWSAVAYLAVGVASLSIGLAIARGAVFVVAVVPVLAGLVVGLRDWRRSIYGLLVFLPFSGIPIILNFPNRLAAVSLKDIFFIVPAYLGFVAFLGAHRRRGGFPQAPAAAIVLFAILVLGDALNPAIPNVGVAAIGAKVWLFYIPLLFLGYHFVRTRHDLERVLKVMSLAAIVPATIGLFEAALAYSGQTARVYGFYGSAAGAVTQNFSYTTFSGGGALVRIPSTFSFPAQYYAFLVAMIAASFAWWRMTAGRPGTSNVARLVWLLMVAAALVSGSRGAFIVVPVLVLLMVLLEARSLPRAVPGVVVLVAIFYVVLRVIGSHASSVLSFGANLSLHYFQELFVHGLGGALHLTLLGLGTGVDTNAARYALSGVNPFVALGGTWAESWYVKATLELGVVGLVVLVVLLAQVVVASVRGHRLVTDAQLRGMSAAFTAFLIWNIAYNVKGGWVDIDPINVYFWFFAGVLFKAQTLGRTATDSSGVPELAEAASSRTQRAQTRRALAPRHAGAR